MAEFEGKSVLVLGGSRGIGAAIVRRFAKDKAAVTFTYSGSREAAELLAGPASAKRSIILGDFNSDTVTKVQPGDAQAYQALLGGGFAERSTADTNSCCVSDLFSSPATEFDHRVDHVMTNMGKKVKLAGSEVTGREQVNGIYNSDHAGIFSKLKVK